MTGHVTMELLQRFVQSAFLSEDRGQETAHPHTPQSREDTPHVVLCQL